MANVVIFGVQDFAQLAHFYLRHDSEHHVVAFSVNEEFLPVGGTFEGLPVVAFERVEAAYPPAQFSFFAPMSLRILLARRLGALNDTPIVLAPRGELSTGALGLKAVKKRSFLRLAHRTGLYRDVIFHASTEHESAEILRAIDGAAAPRVARNPITVDPTTRAACVKAPGAVRFVFLSRIARKKNLHIAIELLRSLKGSVEFDIYGPVIDAAYWRECQSAIGTMPDNVTVHYRGAVAHEIVQLSPGGKTSNG